MNAETRQNRVHSRQEWKELIGSCAESGKTRREYCLEQGLRYETFRRWVGIFERAKEEEQGVDFPRDKFQEIRLNFAQRRCSSREHYELELGSGLLRIPGNFSEQTLVRLLMVLRRA